MKHRLLSVLATLLLSAGISSAVAQEARPEYGILGQWLSNQHTGDFKKLGTFPSCCPQFTTGSGSGPGFGAWLGLPLSNNLRLLTRLTYTSESGVLQDDERSFVADLRDTINPKVVDATFHHELTATLTSIGIQPMLAWRAVGGLDIMGGLRVGLVTTSTFRQTEVLTQPDDYGAYLGTGRTWVDTGGPIPDGSSLRATLSVGARYVLPLNADHSLFLAPEFTYQYALTGVTSSVTWNVHQLSAGLGLAWSPAPTSVTPIPVRDTVPPPPPSPVRPFLAGSVRMVGVEEGGKETSDVTIRIEEVIASDLRPLLNHVYFDEGSSRIPDRYIALRPASTSAFREDQLYSTSTMDTYHTMLNIIGNRLSATPAASITLTGCTSEDGSDKGSELARKRAEAVRTYLTSVWGIDATRVTVNARTLPSKPTRSGAPADIQLASEENRRVEIESNNDAILMPVRTTDTVRTANPPALRVYTESKAQAGVQRWAIDITQDGRNLYSTSSAQLGTTVVPLSVDWRVTSDRTLVPKTESPVEARLTMEDVGGGLLISVPARVPVRQLTIQKKRVERIEDREIDRFSLILFDFNDASVKGQNGGIIRLIKDRITPNSLVTINGYTDVLGTESYNEELSRNRAIETARSLGLPVSSALGLGEQRPLYPNTLPEGRAYNRTVTVTVETPIK